MSTSEGDGPARVGSRCVTTRRIGGSDRTTTSEITEVEPPRCWPTAASTARSGPG
jgi:hypothetical protein